MFDLIYQDDNEKLAEVELEMENIQIVENTPDIQEVQDMKPKVAQRYSCCFFPLK